MNQGPISDFIEKNFLHFNAASLVDAAKGYRAHIRTPGNQMMVTLAGAMSTAELGVSLAEMIREGKVHAISTTGANLEEDLFNLVGHDDYVRIPNYRDLTPEQEKGLLERNLARVTDTCIPEEQAMKIIERPLVDLWVEADQKGERYFPHEFLYRMIRSGKIADSYQIDPKNSWLLAACEKNLPIYTPGWEDSTTGNFFAARLFKGEIKNPGTVKSGVECFVDLIEWYQGAASQGSVGFFQIGGGIAGDFPICVVPSIQIDLKKEDLPRWGYFCQISDSTTSYGSYSGAVPNEKITWSKLDISTPRFVIESDATIVTPLIFSYVLFQ